MGEQACGAGHGLSLASGEGHAAFNNALAGGTTGVVVGAEAKGVRLDHNLYFNLFTGKFANQLGRKTLGDWKYLSGLDAHSVEAPLTFRDPTSGDYRPAGFVGWSLDRAPTSDWGASTLDGIVAPLLQWGWAASRDITHSEESALSCVYF